MSDQYSGECERGAGELGPKHTKRVFKNGTLANALFPMVRRALRVRLFSATCCVFMEFFRLKVELFSTFQHKALRLINVTLGPGSQSGQARGGLYYLKTDFCFDGLVAHAAPLSRRTRLFCPAPMKRSCVRNLPEPSVTLMSGAPPRLALES